VITLGGLARTAFETWATQPATAARLHHAALRHPTHPESAARGGSNTLAEATAELLDNWNARLPALHGKVHPDQPTPLRRYGDRWQPGDLAPIPEADLPAGCPPWWRALEAWASRTGADRRAKRATITVTIPRHHRPWPPIT